MNKKYFEELLKFYEKELDNTLDFWYKFQCHMYNSSGNDWGSNVNVWYPGNSQNFKYQFTIPKTTLTLAQSGANGTATLSSGISNTIALNTEYTLTASEVEGYDFVNWTTTDGSISIVNPESKDGAKVKFTSFTSATVTANYTTKTYTVTWIVDKAETTETVAHGLKVASAPTIDPNNLPCGDKFVGWTTAFYVDASNPPTTLYPTAADIPAITSDMTFYAVFADYEE